MGVGNKGGSTVITKTARNPSAITGKPPGLREKKMRKLDRTVSLRSHQLSPGPQLLLRMQSVRAVAARGSRAAGTKASAGEKIIKIIPIKFPSS